MSKKIKQQEKQYIAINSNSEDTIAVGNRKDVIEMIEEYCYGEGWDKDDIEDTIAVFELGPQVDINVEVDVKISF
jgi:hypothetical protein